jgi:hypothetical protein
MGEFLPIYIGLKLSTVKIWAKTDKLLKSYSW